VIFSRQGTAQTILGLVTDDPQLSAADLIRTYNKRWTIEPCVKDTKQLLGLGHYQHRSYWAAVTHLHLVCFAYALLTHLRLERQGAQGRRTHKRAAAVSTAAPQDQLRALLWDDLITSLKEKCHG
jgi:SRSO17 transposase